MTREEKINLLNKLLEIEEKLDIGNLTRAEKGEFRQWVETLEQEQEPMVEIDLYSVIKQKYIEREVLDKIRAEIADLSDADAYGDYQQGFNFGLMRAAQILGKYKAETEDT